MYLCVYTCACVYVFGGKQDTGVGTHVMMKHCKDLPNVQEEVLSKYGEDTVLDSCHSADQLRAL